jgi:hypothetical protein
MNYLLLFHIFAYIYSSVYRRNIKRKYKIIGLVQDHHIIPRQFKNIIDYDNSLLINNIDSSKNLIMMPTRYGKLFINTNRTIHENGHKHYNRYINKLINQNYSTDFIISHVKYQIRIGNVEQLI